MSDDAVYDDSGDEVYAVWYGRGRDYLDPHQGLAQKLAHVRDERAGVFPFRFRGAARRVRGEICCGLRRVFFELTRQGPPGRLHDDSRQ